MAVNQQYHYTDGDGYKAICSQTDWLFKASKPPADHAVGAYFTTLEPDTVNLANRLRVAKKKIAFVFCFEDKGDLLPLRGDRGRFISYSPADYLVERDRQLAHGEREKVMEQRQ